MSDYLPPIPQFNVGDCVRVKDPHGYIADLRQKFIDRLGVIEKLDSGLAGDFMLDRVLVRFLKRNGRGKEFTRWMQHRDLIPSPKPSEEKP